MSPEKRHSDDVRQQIRGSLQLAILDRRFDRYFNRISTIYTLHEGDFCHGETFGMSKLFEWMFESFTRFFSTPYESPQMINAQCYLCHISWLRGQISTVQRDGKLSIYMLAWQNWLIWTLAMDFQKRQQKGIITHCYFKVARRRHKGYGFAGQWCVVNTGISWTTS